LITLKIKYINIYSTEPNIYPYLIKHK